MSRVGKKPVTIPSNVEFTMTGNHVTIKGPKGTLTQVVHPLVELKREGDDNNVITFSPASNVPGATAQTGTMRSLVSNMIIGVSNGFEKGLELVGVGYRAKVNGNVVELALGFSHNIEYTLPEGVTAASPSNTSVILSSADKQKLGQVAAEIRAFRRPEPYKGKGVKYVGEVVARKEAKKK